MVRQHSDDSRKACIRHKFIELFPQAFVKRNTTLPDIILLDLLQYIKNIGPPKPTDDSDLELASNGDKEEEISEYEKEVALFSDYGGAITWLTYVVTRSIAVCTEGVDPSYRQPLVVVIMIDKYRYTCPARRIVHHKRQKVREKELGKGKFELPTITDTIEYPFDQITEDKEGNSEVLFRFLSSNILKELAARKFDRRVYFIFDGHCIDDDYKVIINNLESPDSVTGAECYDTPIGLLVNGSERSISWMIPFRNTTGESDFLPFFYTKNLQKLDWKDDMVTGTQLSTMEMSRVTCIISVDIDSILYALTNLDIRHKKDEYNSIFRVMYKRISKKQEPEWANINELLEYIKDTIGRAGGSGMSYPALQLVTACLAAGSDYMENHYFVPQYHFIDAYRNYPDLIGNVVDVCEESADGKKKFYKMALNASNYVKLICLAYYTSKKDNKLWKDYDPLECPPTYSSVMRRLVENYPDNDKFWLPSIDDLKFSACQMQYYLNMLSRLGKSRVDIELHDSNLEDYQYEHFKDDQGRPRMMRKIHRYNEEEIADMVQMVAASGSKYPIKNEKKKKKKNADVPPKKRKTETKDAIMALLKKHKVNL
jgi:hypothetical protein